MPFWTYILRCADDSYYTGHTDALEFRIAQHEQGVIPGCHTLPRRPVTLVFSQDFESREDAFLAERRIKGWRREKKEALIAGRFDLLPALARTARDRVQASPAAALVLRQAQDERLRGADRKSGSHASQDSMPPAAGQSLDTWRGEPTDERCMRQALELAERAELEDDEIPVGAILVDAAGQVIGEGWNRNIAEHDATAHAEIVAMRAAGKALGNHRLVGCTLYVTLEPCAMCAMAMVHARIARLVYAASDPKTGAAGSVFNPRSSLGQALLADPRHNHRVEVRGGVLADLASARLSNYFRRKRGKTPSA